MIIKKTCPRISLRKLALITTMALFLSTRVVSVLAYSTSVDAGGPYLQGQVVTISGDLTEAQAVPLVVRLVITKPSGSSFPLLPSPEVSAGQTYWSKSYTLDDNDETGIWHVSATPSGGGTEATDTFLVQTLVTATTTVIIRQTIIGTTTVVQTTSGDLTVPTVITQLSVTTVTAPTTSTSFLPSYTTSTTTETVAESTTTASTEVTETSAGASVTVTQIVIIVTQTETYILETLTSSSTESRTTTILVPGTTETQHGTTSQTTYAIETTKTVDYLLVALAFATPALLLAWALILLRRRY